LSEQFLAKVITNRRNADPAPISHPEKLPAKLYGIMTATTLVTFATLTAGYQLLFTNQLFA
jgi:hypothetical protein